MIAARRRKMPEVRMEAWRPAAVKGAIYRNKIMHFKEPIPTTGGSCHKVNRQEEWALRNFFSTGEAICRFCFRLASDLNGEVFVVRVLFVRVGS